MYLNTIQLLFTESNPGQRETVLAKITKLQTLKDLNCETDIYLPLGFDYMKQELSLFLLGSPVSEYLV